jgi:hypothetical protein
VGDTVVRASRIELAKEALELLAELWPKPSFSTVMIETHQWIRLRRLLVSLPEELLDGQGITGGPSEA